MEVDIKYSVENLQSLIDQKTPKEPSKLTTVFKYALAAVSVAAIATGVYRKVNLVIAGGSVGLVALAFLHRHIERKREAASIYPEIFKKVETDPDYYPVNVMKAVILGKGSDREKFQKIKDYIQIEKLEAYCQKGGNQFLQINTEELLTEFNRTVQEPALKQEIDQLRIWMLNPTVTWNACLNKVLSPGTLEAIPSTDLADIRTAAAQGTIGALELLEKIAEYQVTKWEIHVARFNISDGVPGSDAHLTGFPEQEDASQNGYYQVGLYYFNKNQLLDATSAFGTSIRMSSLISPAAIQALKAPSPLTNLLEFGLWKNEILRVGVVQYENDDGIVGDWIKALDRDLITNATDKAFLAGIEKRLNC